MTVGAFDFRKPPSGELGRQAAGWLALASRRAAGAWPRTLVYKAELRPGPVEAVTAGAALAGLPDDAVGTLISPADPADGALLLAVRRPVLLALLAGLLGDAPSALPADRDPSDLEASLVGYLLRELFVDPLERSWPGADPLALAAGPVGTPRSLWRLPAADPALLATLTVSGPFGDHPVHLLLSRAGRWERLARPAAPAAVAADADRGPSEALVREMRVELDVVLGTAELTMSDIGRLRAGDLVLLRQRVTDPLDGRVSGSRKFRVWPGAVGTRAAVQVDAPADD